MAAPGGATPALAITTSRRSKLSTDVETTPSMASESVTSAAMPMARSPMDFAARVTASSSRSVSTT
jgi:hypothetical protein